MPVRKVHPGADPDELARRLTQAHPSLLGPQVVSHQQVRLPCPPSCGVVACGHCLLPPRQVLRLMTKLVAHAVAAAAPPPEHACRPAAQAPPKPIEPAPAAAAPKPAAPAQGPAGCRT